MTQNKPDDTGALTDAATISEQIREHELLRQTFRDAISSVGEEHYEQWAGMGPEQVLNQSQGGMCICRKSGTGLGVSQEGFGP